MLESLENKIYESVNKNGLHGIAMIPGALILDTKKFIEVEDIIGTKEKIKNYAFAVFMELKKLVTFYGLFKFAQEYIKKQKTYLDKF